MKTVEKKYYVCDICGKVAQYPEKVQKCQEVHKDISVGTIEPDYRKGKIYPKSVLIVFDDGSKAEYVYNYSVDANGKITDFDA